MNLLLWCVKNKQQSLFENVFCLSWLVSIIICDLSPKTKCSLLIYSIQHKNLFLCCIEIKQSLSKYSFCIYVQLFSIETKTIIVSPYKIIRIIRNLAKEARQWSDCRKWSQPASDPQKVVPLCVRYSLVYSTFR